MDHCLVIFSVVTERTLLTASVGYLLAKETFIILAMTAVIGSPEFKVRRFSSSIFYTLALASVEARKISVGQKCVF